MIEQQLNARTFDFITAADKGLIVAFTKALEDLGDTYGGSIGSGFCLGRYMLVFRKADVKSRNVAARALRRRFCASLPGPR